MKKSFSILSLCVVSIFVALLVGCKPEANPDFVYLNESCEIYEDGKLVATVSYIEISDESIENTIADEILIIETITIAPSTTMKLKEDDFLLSIGYDIYESDADKYKTSIEYNEIKNQYNIFENNINEEVTYKFCFIVPKEVNGVAYNSVGITLLVFHQYSLVNSYR